MVREQEVPLSRLIDIVNERFGTDFNRADQLFFDQIVEAAVGDESLRHAAEVNPENRLALLLRNLLRQLFIERMDQNEEIVVRYMNDERFQATVTEWMVSETYRRPRVEPVILPVHEVSASDSLPSTSAQMVVPRRGSVGLAYVKKLGETLFRNDNRRRTCRGIRRSGTGDVDLRGGVRGDRR